MCVRRQHDGGVGRSNHGYVPEAPPSMMDAMVDGATGAGLEAGAELDIVSVVGLWMHERTPGE